MASITSVSVTPDSKTKFLNILIANAARWASEGWGGYVGPDFVRGHALQVSLVTPNLTLDQAKASMKPLTDFVAALSDERIVAISNITTLPSGYHDFINTPFVQAFSILNNVYLAPASRLVPKTLFDGQENQTRLANALGQIVASGQPNGIIPFYVLFVPPSSFQLPASDIAPNGPGAASVTPAWVRRSSLTIILPLYSHMLNSAILCGMSLPSPFGTRPTRLRAVPAVSQKASRMLTRRSTRCVPSLRTAARISTRVMCLSQTRRLPFGALRTTLAC